MITKKQLTVALMSLKVFSILILISFLQDSDAQSLKSKLDEKCIFLPTGVTLRYVEHGRKDGIPIIFLHGYSDSWRSFEHVISKFPEEFHVFAISQRGHGSSCKPKNYLLESFAADVAAFIKKKKLGSCIIAGHSLGGLVTQEFALFYPDLTRAIVIIGSDASFKDNPGVPEFINEVMKLEKVDYNFAKAFQKSTISKPVDSLAVEVFVKESLKLPLHAWKKIGTTIMATDFNPELGSITSPTLILWGTNDSICRREDQLRLAKGIKNSDLIVYDGVGHAIHWEDADRFVQDVVNFVTKVEGRTVESLPK